MVKYALVILVVLFSACNSKKTPRDAKMIEPGSKVTVLSQGNYQLGDFSLDIPDNWVEEEPSSQMRVTEFKLEDAPEYAVVVSFFGDMGNNVEANIERWEDQFAQLESSEEIELNIKKIKVVMLKGTFKTKPFPMSQEFTETPDYGMLASIIPTEKGPYFFKLTAPNNVIDAQRETFAKVMNSYQQ